MGPWVRRSSGCRRSRRRARPGIDIGCGSDGRGAERRELQLRRPALPERVAERAAQHLVHERLLEEPHLRLRRMDVDVDAVGRNPDEQVHLRAALLDRRDAVGLRNRVRDRAVLDDAAVDEDVLGAADRPLVAERRDVAVNLQAARFLAQLDQIEPLAEQLEEPLAAGRPPADTPAACGRRWSA